MSRFLKSLDTLLDTLLFIKIYPLNRSSSGSVSYNYTLEKSEELMKHTDLTKPYVLYIHGYEEHPSNESVQTIVSCK